MNRTRTYWMPSSGGGAVPRQILKNSGYIDIVLEAVQYKARGNFWQRLFHGSDKIAVSTKLSWQGVSSPITAQTIQDFRKVSVPSTNELSISRHIALKMPAVADGIEMQVNLSAVHDDNLGKTLSILNSDDFKKPLALAPVAVGEILTITNLVKKAFTDTNPEDMLSASYPGIIGDAASPDPVAANRLVEGYIVVVVKQDDEDQLDFDPATLAVGQNGLTVSGQPIPNTYMVYNVRFEETRGADTTSSWWRKFNQASSKADELAFAEAASRKEIIDAAYDLLKQGYALLDDDPTYIASEKKGLKALATKDVKDKIAANADTPQMGTDVMLRTAVAALDEDVFDSTDDLDVTVQDYREKLARAGLLAPFTMCRNVDEVISGNLAPSTADASAPASAPVMIPCKIKSLPPELRVAAAQTASQINPLNAPPAHLQMLAADTVIPVEHLAVLTARRWGTDGVHLTVGFLDNPEPALRARILSHMNAWGAYANVQFVESNVSPQVRISRTPGDGYWSYLGTDILHIAAHEPTMNLDSFTMNTPESEFHRVVRHETGHTLGFPHEHLRSEIISRIDKEKAIRYFQATQGWSRDQVIAQVLTPLNQSALNASAAADPHSIMCYGLPGAIMRNGVAVPGGTDIDQQDADFVSTLYPLPRSGRPGQRSVVVKVPLTAVPVASAAG